MQLRSDFSREEGEYNIRKGKAIMSAQQEDPFAALRLRSYREEIVNAAIVANMLTAMR